MAYHTDDFEPVPDAFRALLARLYELAATDQLGILSAINKETGKQAFILAGRTDTGLIPLGELMLDGADRYVPVTDAEPTPPPTTFDLDPEGSLPTMDDYTATMIAEGVIDADELTQLRAWQHLEDTGLGYKLQGFFGRQLQRLIEAGEITPRKVATDA